MQRFFPGLSKNADATYVKNEKRRVVPFSVNPFRSKHDLPGGALDEADEGKRPMEWLELAGDLAWTATFSSLTSNTSITEPSAVWNYAIFFGLTWNLWATQTTYDIKYWTNDWWHRMFFASQLGVYAVLASFSGSFNVAWKVLPGSSDTFVGDLTASTAEAMAQNQKLWTEKSFRGVNMVLFLSRIFLFSQYARVLWYRRKGGHPWSRRFLLTPLATLGAGLIFLGCFIMLKDLDGTRSVAIAQLGLWAVATIIQIAAAAFTPEDEDLVLKSTGAMAPRLSNLTVIIMGEGLSAICATLRNIINSLGLTSRMVSEAVTMMFILYFVWLLYFDGFRVKYSRGRFLEEVWLWLHFPLHLSLILLLEGMKNVFIYVNVLEALNLLSTAFQDAVTYFHENGKFPDHSPFEKLLLVLNMSWEQEVNDLCAAVVSSNSTNATDTTSSQMWRWWSTVTHNVILLYNEQPDPEAEYWFNHLIGSSDAVVANDMDTGGALLYKFTRPYHELMAYSAHWVIAVGGTLLVWMAILNVMRRQPRNRFAWGYTLSRTVIGCFLLLIWGATSGVVRKDWYTWIVPTVAIGYSLAVIVDWVLLYLTVSVQLNDSLNPGPFYGQEDDGSTARLYPAPIAGATYSTTHVTDPYACGQYQAVETYPPSQYHTPYQPNPNGLRRSYND